MEDYASSLISQYRTSGVLVDTNLLLLLYVGGYNRALVAKFRRTRTRFVTADFDALRDLLDPVEKLVTTPYILTEVSNLMGQLKPPAKAACFRRFAQSIAAMHEDHTPSAELAGKQTFVPLGITDTSILEVAAQPYLVLTQDAPLYNRLASRGIEVLNYNHIRPLDF